MARMTIVAFLFSIFICQLIEGRRPSLFIRMTGSGGQSPNQPVLQFREPTTKCNVHLIGVSHGSSVSASLVQDVMQSVRPSVVVLELCDDRYLSISLDNRIRPNSNATFQSLYDKKLNYIQQLESAPSTPASRAFNNFLAYLRFFRQQGPLIGSFVSIGLFVSSLQRMFKAFPKGDEFTTAMRTANELNIPVRVCDAPQQQTLQSLQNLISWDTLNPGTIIEATKLLMFSAFGFQSSGMPWTTAQGAKTVSPTSLINIPSVYVNDKTMLKSLTPIAVIFAWSILLGLLPSNGEAMELLPPLVTSQDVSEMTDIVQSIVGVDNTPTDTLNAVGEVTVNTVNSGWEWLQTAASSSLSPEVDQAINSAITAFSMLLLVRMAKIIGADRDRIISKNLKQICKDYPVSFIHRSRLVK